MAVNPWLSGQNFPQQEKDLMQSLIDESIQIKGIDVRYLVRNMENRDFQFGESPISSFKEFFEIEMYLSEIVNFNGQGDIFGAFGLQMNDSAVFEVSTNRFSEEAGDRFKLTRPREGDLIYLPTSDSIYEIVKVENDRDYHQLGKNYRYILRCELFRFSHEEFADDTPEDDIADFHTDNNMMAETLGIKSGIVNDISDMLEDEEDSIIKTQFDLNNPFGEKRN